MAQRPRQVAALVGLIVLNVALLPLWLHDLSPTPRLAPRPPERLQQDAVGQLNEQAGSWTTALLVFTGDWEISNIRASLPYLNVLATRFASRGLKVIVLSSDRGGYAPLLEHPHLVFAPAAARSLKAAFALRRFHTAGGVAFLDRSGRVVFWRYGVPLDDELRQLTEKTLLGEIDLAFHSFDLNLAFPPGRLVASLPVLDVRHRQVSLPEVAAGKTFIVFPFQSDGCSLRSHLQRLRSLSYLGGVSPTSVLLSTRFDPRIVNELLSEGDLPKDTFFIRPTSLGIDDYVTRLAPPYAPIVVQTDDRGAVIAREVIQ